MHPGHRRKTSKKPQKMANSTLNQNHGTTSSDNHWFKTICYNKTRDEPKDARNVLLVVAALITAVTFQAGVNPPGGVWQDSQDGHTAGRAIYAMHKHAFYVFLIFNTLSLSSAIFVIVSLTYKFPFHFELWIATMSMIITYSSAVFAITPSESVHFRYILIAAAGPYVSRLCIELLKGLGVWCKVYDMLRSVPDRFKSLFHWIKG